MLLNRGVGENTWESLGLQGDLTSPYLRKSVLNIHWKDWCWSWNSNTLVTWCKELSHWKRPWCWERLKTGGEGDNRGWDGWMASSTQWIWIWASSGSWWWTGRPGVLRFMGSQRVGHDWETELNWTMCVCVCVFLCISRFATPGTVACQAPLSIEFSRQEHWSGLPFLSPGTLPDPGIESMSHVSCIGRQVLYQLSCQGSPVYVTTTPRRIFKFSKNVHVHLFTFSHSFKQLIRNF